MFELVDLSREYRNERTEVSSSMWITERRIRNAHTERYGNVRHDEHS
jgi:hypothetical protein